MVLIQFTRRLVGSLELPLLTKFGRNFVGSQITTEFDEISISSGPSQVTPPDELLIMQQYIYLQFHRRRCRGRPHFYQMALISLYLLITLLTVLSTLANFQQLLSSTFSEISNFGLSPSLSKPDAHYFDYFKLKWVAAFTLMIPLSQILNLALLQTLYL